MSNSGIGMRDLNRDRVKSGEQKIKIDFETIG